MKIAFLLPLLSLTVNGLPFGLSIPWLTGSSDSCLIKLGPNEYKVIQESEKLQLKREGVNFIDVTSQISINEAISKGYISPLGRTQSLYDQITLFGAKQLDKVDTPVHVYDYPKKAAYQKSIVPIFDNIDVASIQENLSNFTSFYTRYYKSQSGYELAIWLKAKINEILTPAAEKNGVTVSTVDHKKWDQFSIIVTIPGSSYKSATDKGDIVVIGSHQDSTNLVLPNLMRAPGADDDGSGTVTCLEALRLIMQQYNAGDFKSKNTLEFHFYSAEEGGLLGSIDVFTQYKQAEAKIIGMLQQDMTGFTAKSEDEGVEPHMGLITDYTTPNLNNFVKLMIDTYCDIPYHETSCGYACSDHSSAVENGYPASFVIESEFSLINGYIHSVLDTVDRIDWDHLVEHVKLTIGFAYELSNSNV